MSNLKSLSMDWVKIFNSREEAAERLVLNKPQLLIARGVRICIVLTEGGMLAVGDRCTHNGESLSKGVVNFVGEIVCPWHGHRFGLKTGRECDERSADLPTFPVREDSEGVFIGL